MGWLFFVLAWFMVMATSFVDMSEAREVGCYVVAVVLMMGFHFENRLRGLK